MTKDSPEFAAAFCEIYEWRRQFANTAQFVQPGVTRDIVAGSPVRIEQLVDRFVKERNCLPLRDELISQMKERDHLPHFLVVQSQWQKA